MNMKNIETIEVTIPPQKFDIKKYYCHGETGKCYLDDAILAFGFTSVHSMTDGAVVINGMDYRFDPTKFNAEIVEKAFSKKKSVKVMLFKDYF